MTFTTRTATTLFIGLVLIVLTLLGVAGYGAWTWFSRPVQAAGRGAETPYQAVLLTNGAVYFGKLQGLGTPFPVLTEVFYIQSGTNAETKQTSAVLVKRGRELHAPNRMVLNAQHILLVEPVGPDSRVAQLIAESKR
jgi:hypothetical protein